MTLAKASNYNVVKSLGSKVATYNIGFNGNDETQFCASNMKDLKDLWMHFCEENGFVCTNVDYVEMVYSKEDHDEYGENYYFE